MRKRDIMTDQTLKIVKVIKAIPSGKVLSYGEVGNLAGYERAARQVSWTLRTQTKKHDLPWHRVIGAGGKISLKDEGALIQKQCLESEKVVVNCQGKVDMKVYNWSPTPYEIDRVLRKS